MADFNRLFQEMIDWEEVKDLKTLSKIKTVEEMLPIPAKENQLANDDPHIWERHYQIIEECLKQDCTIEEACMYAGISTPSYYHHRRKNPDFAIRMDRARQFPKMMARAAVMKRIAQWDAKTALRYLELRDKKRYNSDPNISEDDEQKEESRVQFISVPSDEWANNTTSHDIQNDIKLSSVSDSSVSSWEKMTPWENEEEALRRLDSLNFSNG